MSDNTETPQTGATPEASPETILARESALMGVPIEVVISVGRARPMIGDLLKLRRDSVLALDSRIEDPVEIFVGDKLIARGELQEMEGDPGKLGVRLIEVVDLPEAV